MKSNNTRRVTDMKNMPTDIANQRIIRLHCDYVRRTGARPRTIEHRNDNLRRIAAHLPVPLLDATPEQLDAWQAALTVATTSIATYTNHVVAFYRWAIQAGHLDIDPSTRLPRPKVAARVARPIPESELQVALVCAPEPVRTWLILSAFMGLRAMEIAQIRREDITEHAGRLILTGVGKGGKPFRLPVPTGVVPALGRWLTAARGPLWRLPNGQPVRSTYVSHEVSRFFRSIGMHYTLHCGRHRFGTLAYRQTRDLLLTQDLMRHSDPSSTRLYIETANTEAAAAMDRLSQTLRPGEAA